jgi:hypothetical protein
LNHIAFAGLDRANKQSPKHHLTGIERKSERRALMATQRKGQDAEI